MSHTPPNAEFDFTKLTSRNIADFIGDIFEKYGGQEYLGEAVTIAEHMLQTATTAQQAGFSEKLIVGALLHDVGHFTGDLGAFDMADKKDRLHEDAGAEFLADLFPLDVTDIVRHHVSAKRYLCATNPKYFDRLSIASIHSLSLQGGPMSDKEVARFEMLPRLSDIIKVRYLDDAGKKAGLETPDYWHFAPMIQRVVDDHLVSQNSES